MARLPRRGDTARMPSLARTFDPAALRRLWEGSGLTTAELAARVAPQRNGDAWLQQVRRWVRGDRSPDLRYLPRLAAALGVPAHALTTVRPQDARLYDLRVWAGLTQRELAERAALNPVRYARLEKGTVLRVQREAEVAAALADVLGEPVAVVALALRRTRDDAFVGRLGDDVLKGGGVG